MSRPVCGKLVVFDKIKFKKVVDPANPRMLGLPMGQIHTDELAEIPSGGSFFRGGRQYWVLDCDIHDYVMEGLHRSTQIIYPKEAAYIIMRMDITPGARVGEAGTGSGALASAMSRAVGPEGRIYTYEENEDLKRTIRRNLRRHQDFTNVVIHEQSLADGIEERGLDAFVLDVRHPWEVLDHVYDALRTGGHLCILVPTTNQVSDVLRALSGPKFFITDVLEIMHRHYKVNAARLRPWDRMVAHTGYLVFARRMIVEAVEATEPEGTAESSVEAGDNDRAPDSSAEVDATEGDRVEGVPAGPPTTPDDKVE
ncbi:MAG: tRNA (adenine-N1)-methyltransferase [Desulfatibacillaceae bacterium]